APIAPPGYARRALSCRGFAASPLPGLSIRVGGRRGARCPATQPRTSAGRSSGPSLLAHVRRDRHGWVAPVLPAGASVSGTEHPVFAPGARKETIGSSRVEPGARQGEVRARRFAAEESTRSSRRAL